MKKLIALLLALALLCSLAGCGRQTRAPSDDDSAAPAGPPRAPSVSDPAEDEPDEPDEPEDPAQTDASLQMEDYLGSWAGNVYSNKALGLSFTQPDGWEHSSDEELLELLDGAANSEILSDRTKLATELAKSRMFYGMVAQDPVSGISVQLMFANLDGMSTAGGAVTEEDCARAMAAQQEGLLAESSGAELSFEDTYHASLGGVDFLILPATIQMSGVAIRQWYCIHIVENYQAVIAITAMGDQDINTMEGGASAFAPLAGGAAGGSGASGALTATGDIGRTYSTMFFDFTVVSAESPAEYYGYTPESGNKLIVVRVRVTNDFGSTLPMYDTDFILFWGNGDGDGTYAIDAFNDGMMPLEWEIEDGKTAEYDMLFEAPADKMEFSLSYLEEYTDRNGNDKTGDWYDANFTLLASASA